MNWINYIGQTGLLLAVIIMVGGFLLTLGGNNRSAAHVFAPLFLLSVVVVAIAFAIQFLLGLLFN